jgi:DNA-binding MarR family transcriptional regulator
VNADDQRAWRLLAEVGAGHGLSQRRLASKAGIALGLTNLLIRRMVGKGWIRVVRTRSNRVAYSITAAGLKEKGRMSRDYLHHTMRFYADARACIGERLQELTREWGGAKEEPKRIAFYGTGEIAEIAYVCLQGTDLCLVAVLDDRPIRPFFGLEVHPLSRIREDPNLLQNAERIVVVTPHVGIDEVSADFRRFEGLESRFFWL